MSTTAVASPVPSPPEGDAGHQHLVEFYETDATLACAVARFLAPSTTEPGAAIVVATPAHRAAFEEALTELGVDVAGAFAAGRYVSFDAAALLSSFTVDGVPDQDGFRREVGAVLARMTAARQTLRIYGEMVALLWEAGNVASALALEDFWNDIRSTYDFDLLCAYRVSGFDNEDDAVAFRRLCEQHESRPEQVLLAELAYADAVATALNRRVTPTKPAPARSHRRGDDSLILSAWRNTSQLMASPGGRVLGDIVATEVCQAPSRSEEDLDR
jgi:hypothetical protein